MWAWHCRHFIGGCRTPTGQTDGTGASQSDGAKGNARGASQNYGSVILEFDVALTKIKLCLMCEKMDRVKSELPDDAEEPDVREFNANLFRS